MVQDACRIGWIAEGLLLAVAGQEKSIDACGCGIIFCKHLAGDDTGRVWRCAPCAATNQRRDIVIKHVDMHRDCDSAIFQQGLV